MKAIEQDLCIAVERSFPCTNAATLAMNAKVRIEQRYPTYADLFIPEATKVVLESVLMIWSSRLTRLAVQWVPLMPVISTN